VRFLVDAQLPPALVDWLQKKGYQAQHVFDAGLSRAEDGAVWDHASRSGDKYAGW
jgi:predicted nuclease of predicted toxin-antitoxin system